MSKQFTLGKNERLRSRKQIEKIFDQGRSFVVGPLRVYFLMNDESEVAGEKYFLQFGVGVSSKNFRRAVDRNRIKRLLREAWRLQKNELGGATRSIGKRLNVFLIYTGKELPDFIIIKEKVAVALKKLLSQINENNFANS